MNYLKKMQKKKTKLPKKLPQKSDTKNTPEWLRRQV